MRLVDETLRFSPSDLGNFAACEHLTQLEIAAALEEIEQPHFVNAFDELRKRKGDEHEAAFLEALRAQGHEVVEIGLGEERDFAEASARTAAAMRAGAAYVYQAVLVVDGWRGIADFLERVERPSALGSYSYEVLDTKLARRARPSHALQLCFYSEAVARIQGAAPEHAAVVLGTSERHVLRLADVEAYYRRLKRRFQDATAARPATEPFRCDHCGICDWRPHCNSWWEQRDHLVRVAGMRRGQIERFAGAGIGTLTALAEAPPGREIEKLQPETYEALREQAELQLHRTRTGELLYRLRPVEPGRGLASLPPPSEGDVMFDFEGHPFFEPARGLEFLFGLLLRDGGEWRYEAIWAHDREAERAALERFVDLVHARLARWPDLHVYHYAGYETTAVKRLMGEYGTREHEVDALLRGGIFVDLYRTLRQALRAGVPGYGLKEVEALAGFVRAASLGAGDEAVVDYERWRETGDGAALERIAAYNEEDCRATLALRDWLLGVRPPDLDWPEPGAGTEVTQEKQDALAERARVRQELLALGEGTPQALAGELLEYHRREARPAWWLFFARLAKSPEELVEETEALGCLEPVGEPEEAGQSLVWTLRFPDQEVRLSAGDRVADPATGSGAGELVELDTDACTLRLRRGRGLAEVPLPRALVGGAPFRTDVHEAALLRFAEGLLAGDGRYAALERLLRREMPRVLGRSFGAPLQTTALGELQALAAGVDASYLFLQGPPGTGKTWRGARLILHLIGEGKRVGVTAQSHKVIHNLLWAVEREAALRAVTVTGLKKASSGNEESYYDGDLVANQTAIAPFADPEVQLVAGTSWLFARPELDGTLDYLVIDEAGQVSLADALAVGTSARNLILLGDPLQLAQVTQGTHPGGSGVSVLEHLLGDEPTIPPERGVFLLESFRMHPDVCTFVSDLVYAGRLGSDPGAAARTTSLGTGIRFLPVEHEGNRSSSPEEAALIAAEIERMAGGTFTDGDGRVRSLSYKDFMVVTPYNAQVHELQRVLPAGVPIGTVDKFQGQQAPVVFFSMATSSGEDVPRSLEFVFSRNRLNVAVSRAQCIAALVCSPRLLEARCRSIEEMQLVNALCRLVEVADAQAPAAR
jgi:uncharacterized protein